MKRPLFPTLLTLALALTLGACSDDTELENTDPGGMGAGRPDAGATAETPADEILTNAGQPENQDTTGAGSGSVTGALRDSATSMSQPQRPAGTDPRQP